MKLFNSKLSLFFQTFLSFEKNVKFNYFSQLASAPLIKPKNELRKTSLYNYHVENGAKMISFANYLLPLVYKNMSLNESHLHTRRHCSLFDVSHMLQTKIFGKDRESFLESLLVSDIHGLKPNQACLSLFTNSRGGIIDDLIVIKTDLNYLYIVTNADCREKDILLLNSACLDFQKANKDVTLEIISDDYSLIALQGPASCHVLQKFINYDIKGQYFMTSKLTSIGGIKDCRITRCGYTGEDGFEISAKNDSILKLVDMFISCSEQVKLAGLGVRDTLRIEAGLCLYGKDINEETTPVEASLSWTIGKSRRASSNFPGSKIILKQLEKKNAPSIKRIGLCEINRGPPVRSGAKIFDAVRDECIGTVTSGSPSPSLKKNIAIGYVSKENSKIGTDVKCEVRGKKYDWKISKMPFISPRYYY